MAAPEPIRMQPSRAKSARYASLARSNTKPELSLRSQLHARGLRYRIQLKIDGLPRRRVDIAFPRQKVAIFVDGCFWHACPEHGTRPRTNREWWDWKLQRNKDRDTDTNRRLMELGWTVLRIWEHEPVDEAVEKVLATLERGTSPRAPNGSPTLSVEAQDASDERTPPNSASP